jgi:hypothetical protein
VTLRTGAFLAAPFLLVAVVARWLVPAWGDSIARHLTSALAGLYGAPRPASPQKGVPTVASPFASGETSDAGALDGGPPLSLEVPAAAIARAFEDLGPHVRGRTVLGADGRPAGIRLSGVTGLKVGLRDGDVIVAVEGEPTLDEGAATEVSLSAIARGASVLHATGLREERALLITADLPPPPPLSPDLNPARRGPGKAR